MTLSRREKILLIIAGYALLVFCFVWLIYLPQMHKIEAIKADNQQLAQEKTRLENIRKKQEQSTPVNNDLALVNEQLPTQQEMIPVLKFLDQSAAKCDVSFASLDYRGANEDEGEARTVTFAVETSGSIFNLMDFLKELLAAPRFISVADISLNACRADNSNVSAEESQPTYYIAPPGIPEAKLQRIKVELEEDLSVSEPEKPVASSFIPDKFNMKITINAYYSPDQQDKEKADKQSDQNAAQKDSEGRI